MVYWKSPGLPYSPNISPLFGSWIGIIGKSQLTPRCYQVLSCFWMSQDTCIPVSGSGNRLHSFWSVFGVNFQCDWIKDRNWRWSASISIGELPWASHNCVYIHWKHATFCTRFRIWPIGGLLCIWHSLLSVGSKPSDQYAASWVRIMALGYHQESWEDSWSPTAPCFCFTQ